jgi:hypothetical protein
MFQTASVLVFASQLLLVADKVPELKVGPSCRAAVQASAGLPNRDENACLEDEKAAKTSLQKEWTQFDADQKAHCMRLLNAGGSPSYVELLTCAEMGKAVKNLNTQKNANTRRTVPAETTGSGSAGSESSDSVK